MDEKTRKILTERNLTSHLNDRKWRKLCAGIEALPFAPAYQVKRLNEAEPYPSTIDYVPDYLGDWGKTYEATLDVQIEWITVAPRYKRFIASALAPVIEDCSDPFRALLNNLRMPFVEREGLFTIYGHSPAIDFDTA